MTEDRNPESERDRLLLEAFKSGEYVTTGRGIKTREEAERRRKQGDEIRNLALLALLAMTTYGEATGANRLGRYINERDAFFAGPYKTATVQQYGIPKLPTPHAISQRPTIPMNPGATAAAPSPRPGPNTRGGGWQGTPDALQRVQAGQTRTPTREDLLDYLRKTYGGPGETYPFPRMGN